MAKDKITVKELRDALATMPDDGVIEVCVHQYNKTGYIYLGLEKSPFRQVAVKPFPDYNTVRLFSSLPQTDETYSILSTRKKK